MGVAHPSLWPEPLAWTEATEAPPLAEEDIYQSPAEQWSFFRSPLGDAESGLDWVLMNYKEKRMYVGQTWPSRLENSKLGSARSFQSKWS
jgi:hypothetical protein